MRILILSTLLLGCWAHDPNTDAQYINAKSVKGGGGQYQYRGGDNLVRFYNNTQSGYYGVKNQTAPVARVGICYMEVPTASLARDPKHVPAGNGSRPDLSRIETCCAGYIRNIHNFHICDPVCNTECVNALCTAPNVCTCFPDHVKNLAGFCVATCPIGCQNGHCSGGECLCKEGFELDRDGKFCMPRCRANCGGIGNCTAPNTCSCQPGYHSTPDGSCQSGSAPPSYHQVPPPHLQTPGHPGPASQSCGSCTDGECVGTECRCRPGYLLYKGVCYPLCNPGCVGKTRCVAPNVCSSSTTPTPSPININQHPNQYPQNPNQPQNINGPYPGQPQNQNGNNGQYPGQYPHNQNNTYNSQYSNQYPGQPQPINNTFSVNYPYPNGQSTYTYNQFSENQQNHTSQGQFTTNQYSNGQYPPQQNPIYGQYPVMQPNSYPHQQYPNQQNNTNISHHGQYPQQPGPQHLYPDLHDQNLYPYQGNNRTDGQVFHHNQNDYNPLENVTFNLQQGHTQGQAQYGNQGSFGQGQYPGPNGGQTGPYGQPGQIGPDGQIISQGQYGQTQFTYGQEQNNQWAEQTSTCAQPCVNGRCVAPNKCECFPGHIFDPADSSGARCVPHCPGGCLNGFCAAPNTCMCLMGYHKDFSVKGRSVCVKRNRRSVETPVNVAELLVFDIPDDE